MPARRILSLWFPRLAAERWLRAEPWLAERPFAVVGEAQGAQVIASPGLVAAQAGLHPGQPLRDAHAMCAGLITRPQDDHRDEAFLTALHRWSGRYSPWVAVQPPDSLVIDLTGCAHLFGGEAALAPQVIDDCAALGLTARVGIADTLGAAWALARYTAQDRAAGRTGDAIQQEAHATRAKAGKRRHWERGGAAPTLPPGPAPQDNIAAPGQAWSALSPLPVAALRLDPDVQAQLSRLGLRRVGDLLGQPRAGLARRFGRGLVDRLDQALGSVPESINATPPARRFAVRLSLPDPIGLEADVKAAVARMLETLCATLKAQSRGARTLRLEVHRTDKTMQWQHLSAAVASFDAPRWGDLLGMKLGEIEAGDGIDMLRLEAVRHEALHARAMAGHLDAARMAQDRLEQGSAFDDLVGRLGARVGMEAITRRHPGNSHIPEKGAQILAAAWSDPAQAWPDPPAPRPLVLWSPEPVTAPDAPQLAASFRWRGRDHAVTGAAGPERIAPEWWLDDPAWRSGPRDYWRVETARGDRLWLFYAHGGGMSSGWFCHGAFA